MPAPEVILKLCATFAAHREHYRSGNYNEAQLRKEFLDPFFAALGWYHQYYIAHDPEKLAKGKTPVLVPSRGGGWALTTAERKRILLAHIFGVDLYGLTEDEIKLVEG